MASITEVKASTLYFVAKKIGERLISDIPLRIRERATLATANTLDNEQGDFRESANHFYTVFNTSWEETKAEALVGLAQELINLGRFRQARRFLSQEPPRFFSHITQPRRTYYQARVEEKLGWIADYEGGYIDSSRYFSSARSFLMMIPKEEWTADEDTLYSTSTHFLGRAHYGLASQGINKRRHIEAAVENFEEDLSRFTRLREQGNPAPANEGFGHAWLARCYVELGALGEAEVQIQKTGELFEEHVQAVPRTGIMAHYYLLRGALELKKGELTSARGNFREALRIRTEIEHYPKGFADAAAGMAMTFWREGQLTLAATYALQAFKAYPFIVSRRTLGG